MSVPVLIVDDDEGVLFLHELIIRESGLSENISTFNMAVNALEYLEKQNNQIEDCLIFLDINMPAMNGWKFLDKLDKSNQFSRVFVVMATSSVNRSDREKANSFPRVIGYVEKPLDLDTCDKLKQLEQVKKFFKNGNG